MDELDGFSPGNEFEHHTIKMLHRILEQLETIMSDQTALDALVQHLSDDVTGLQAGVDTINTTDTAIQAEIAALQQQNPALDLTGLTNAVAGLDTLKTNQQAAVDALAAVVPPAPPAP